MQTLKILGRLWGKNPTKPLTWRCVVLKDDAQKKKKRALLV